MVETILEKEQVDKQWDKHNDPEAEKQKAEPSDKQKTYILSLAKMVGLKMDVSKVQDKQKASLLIERLKTLNRQMNGNSFELKNNYKLRDKRVAFGMATKLIFRRFCQQGKDPLTWKRFWMDVNKFYRAYQEQQEQAISSRGDENEHAGI